MAQLTVDLGGRPGVDCRGFCEYCYFKHAREVPSFGCRYCPPFQKGCDYCSRSVRESYSGFRDLREVADAVLADLHMLSGDLTRVTISGGGDPSCYPDFVDLVELVGSLDAPLHIGYTSGKGFDDPGIATTLLDNGLSEVSFTIFASDPDLRRRWMHDPTPDVSLSVLETLCGEAEVYGAAVVLPGVNDGAVLEETCTWLEERGAKGLILMRFANSPRQGLILENAPIIPGHPIHDSREFADLVTRLDEQFDLRVSGTPLWDPGIGSPFAILHEPALLKKLPRATKDATVITGSIAAPFIRKILRNRGFQGRVIGLDKEIACLITSDDLRSLDLSRLSPTVIIPGRAFVHDPEAHQVLSADGIEREVIRGPETLTADGETSMGMRRTDVLRMEMDGFAALINTINLHGTTPADR
ncbi:MAG: methyl coenzyme M reductase-arginine methyltransferase Mmp10 [Methanomicrobiales archaeon]